MTDQRTKGVMNQERRTRRHGVRGRALLLGRLAASDLRHHVTQAVLFVVAIAAATAVLSLAFALNGVNSNPYQQTMAATNGPDIVAQSGNDPYTGVTSPADLAALVALNHAKGVVAHSGPYPIVGDTGPVGATMVSSDISTSVQVEGRATGVAAVDQPKVTAGTWLRPGGVVLLHDRSWPAKQKVIRFIMTHRRYKELPVRSGESGDSPSEARIGRSPVQSPFSPKWLRRIVAAKWHWLRGAPFGIVTSAIANRPEIAAFLKLESFEPDHRFFRNF